ncbi:MAG: hypothetical protein K6F30_06460 [Lachnospiraceae bacterium]|nr:hypothetical protein [Lachnospiraceae bacterium]
MELDLEQKELFFQFLVIYKDMTKRVKNIKEAIPTEEEWKEREKLMHVQTMTGRKKTVSRNLVEEELQEVEDILDDLDVLLARMDQAAKLVDAMVAVA